MEELCEQCSHVHSCVNCSKKALCLAVGRRHVHCMKAMVKSGAGVNDRDSEGNTPVILAAMNGLEGILTELIKLGANVNICNKYGGSAMLWALIKGSNNCVKLLSRAGASMSKNKRLDPLIIKVVNDRRFEYLDVLGRAGACVNTKDSRGEPLVVTMVKDVRYDYLEFLVRAGADVNAVDKENNTPLIAAMKHLRDTEFAMKCVKLLLRAGAEVNIVDCKNLNALSGYIVSYVGSHVGKPTNRKLCMMLLAAGQKVEVAINHTRTPVPEFLLQNDLKLWLAHLCREAIRTHLLQMSPVNLFIRVPQLGLPSLITDFLLYGVEL